MSKFASFAEYPPRSLAGAEAALLTAWASLERFHDDLVLVRSVPIEGTAIIAREKEQELLASGFDLTLLKRAQGFLHGPAG